VKALLYGAAGIALLGLVGVCVAYTFAGVMGWIP